MQGSRWTAEADRAQSQAVCPSARQDQAQQFVALLVELLLPNTRRTSVEVHNCLSFVAGD